MRRARARARARAATVVSAALIAGLPAASATADAPDAAPPGLDRDQPSQSEPPTLPDPDPTDDPTDDPTGSTSEPGLDLDVDLDLDLELGADPDDGDEPAEVDQAKDGEVKVIASVPFDGRGADPFEGLRTGDSGFRQWSGNGPNTFQIVEFDGATYGRAQITGGPHPQDIRAEGIVAGSRPDSTLKFRQGDTLWFGGTIVISDGFPDRFFNNVLQWKNDGTGSAPLFVGAWDGQMQVRSSFGNRAVGAIDKGRPHRYVFGIRFGANGDGWIEVFRDGVQVLGRTSASTLRAGVESYVKIGYYRGDEIVGTGAALHRDFRVGTTHASVR